MPWLIPARAFKLNSIRTPTPLEMKYFIDCWERLLAEASRVDRMAKGRLDGDPWLALERLLLAVCAAPAVRLLARSSPLA